MANRRSFLKRIGIGAVASMVTGPASGVAMTPGQAARVAAAQAGYVSQRREILDGFAAYCESEQLAARVGAAAAAACNQAAYNALTRSGKDQ